MAESLESRLTDANSLDKAHGLIYYLKLALVGKKDSGTFGYGLKDRAFLGLPEIIASARYMPSMAGMALFFCGLTISATYLTFGFHYTLD
ncbi:MAG: hypothetical protein M1433_01185 [Candidatus Parvarchaeota archaeon]|nr:hypothetical protein [Candidatus Parvarchaeota archaeon]